MTSLERAERFHHRDLDELPLDALWAEATLLTLALARRLQNRRCDRLIVTTRADVVQESRWIRERLAQLDQEQRRRTRQGSV
jgi:hypothetical protein